MPFVRMRYDFAFGEAMHFRAHRIERLVETGVADRERALCFGDRGGKLCAGLGIVAGNQSFDGRRHPRGNLGFGKAKRAEAQDFALAHRDAAENLREIFAGADANQQFFDFAEAASLGHAGGIARKLTNRFDISRKPGIAMRCVLFALDRARGESCRSR